MSSKEIFRVSFVLSIGDGEAFLIEELRRLIEGTGTGDFEGYPLEANGLEALPWSLFGEDDVALLE